MATPPLAEIAGFPYHLTRGKLSIDYNSHICLELERGLIIAVITPQEHHQLGLIVIGKLAKPLLTDFLSGKNIDGRVNRQNLTMQDVAWAYARGIPVLGMTC